MAYYLSDDEVEAIRNVASASGESTAYKFFLSLIEKETGQTEKHEDSLLDAFLDEYTTFKGNLSKKMDSLLRLALKIATLDGIIDARVTINDDYEKFEEERNKVLEAVDMDNPVFDAMFSFDFLGLATNFNMPIDKFIISGFKALVGLFYSNEDENFYEYGNFFAVRANEGNYILIYASEFSYSWID